MKRYSKKDITDEELLSGLAENNNEIILLFYSLYFPMIRKMVLQNNGDEASAKDLFQDALMVLYDKVKEKGFSLTSQLQTYLFAVCKRLWLKKLYQKKKVPVSVHREAELPDVEDDITEHEEKEKQFEKLNLVLEQLGAPCKDLLIDFYMGKRSMQELAGKYNYTNADNAKNQKYKCLQRLKKLFFQTVAD